MCNCIFCKIIQKEIKADIVSETENFIAIRDVNPQAPVHVLVIPKKHIASLNEFEKSDEYLIAEANILARKIAKSERIQAGVKYEFSGRTVGVSYTLAYIGRKRNDLAARIIRSLKRKVVFDLANVKIRDGESLEEALRRFKRECEREGILTEIKKREYYESPSVKKRRKLKESKRKSKRLVYYR